ncbi:MAG: sortase, partial [Actinobacteria bacterium]|nr:sortase [Actinomycetota bacterium]
MTTLMRDTETDEQIAIIDSGDALTIVDDIATISPGTTSRVLRSAAGAFAFLIVAFALFLFVASGLIAQRDQVVLERTMRDQLARAVAPIGGNIRVGSPVAVLEIPALDIRQIVAEGSTPEVTKSGAGHVRATPMPGQPGNSVVMARRSTFGAPFRHIDSLIKGD